MIAHNQLELRSRLGLALFSLGKLGESAGFKNASVTVEALVEGIKDPFLFVVAGEVNAGKSMLLNALFGEQFCKTSPLPTTDRIHYFRHGDVKSEKEVAPMVTEMMLPRTFLKDFHIVDTPGVNSVADGHEEVTNHFLPRADAVLFVFSISNPWGERCWEFLKRIHKELGKRIVLVLQQVDLQADEEVSVIVDHLRRTTQRMLGEALPIFPVSARQAFLAKTGASNSADLLKQSRFAALENYLGKLLAASEGRVNRLSNTLQVGSRLLQQVNVTLAEEANWVAQRDHVLKEAIKKVHDQKAVTGEACLKCEKPAAIEIQKMGDALIQALSNKLKLNWRNASSKPPSVPREAALQWTQAAEKILNRQQERLGKLVKDDFSSLLAATRPAVEKALGSSLDRKNAVMPDMEVLQEEHSAILKSLRSQEVWNNAFLPIWRASRIQLLACIWGAGLGLLLGILALILGKLLFLIPAGVLLVLGIMLGAKVVKNSERSLLLKLHACCETDQKCLRLKTDMAVQKWLQRSFLAFQGNFKPLELLVEKHRGIVNSKLSESQNLKQTFSELESACEVKKTAPQRGTKPATVAA